MAIKHVAVRLYFYFLFLLFFITGGLAIVLLAPLYKAAFAPNVPYSSFNAFALRKHLYKIMRRSLSDKNYRSMYSTKLSDPPKIHTDQSKVRIKESWGGEESNCDICKAACCEQLQCPLLGEQGRCQSYGSLFWGYFYCGRYPENQSQIDYYDCPKWEERT